MFIVGFQKTIQPNGLDCKDPGTIVIDEIIGMLVALIGVPLTPLAMAAAFLLFRFFDIVKPFPISWADKRINGGLGIVLDDILAGAFACLAVHIIWQIATG